MPLNLFYTMVQKSQKWPKPKSRGGGPALIALSSHFALPQTLYSSKQLAFFALSSGAWQGIETAKQTIEFPAAQFFFSSKISKKMNQINIKNYWTLLAMQWHAYKRFLAFLSGNLALLFLRLQYILNVFKFRSFIKSLSIASFANHYIFSWDQKLTFNTHKTLRKWAKSSEAETASSKRRPVQPPLPLYREDAQPAKKWQVNNVLPPHRLIAPSLLTTEIVARSKHSSSKKLLLHKKLPKPPKGASKLTSFRAILPVRMHAAVRAEGLLAPLSARFSVDKRCRLCNCKGLGSLLSYPLLVATLCFNPAQGPQTASRSADQSSAVAELPSSYTGTGSTHTLSIGGGPPERRLHFDSPGPTRTRVNSDSCVNDGYCLRHFSVDTAPSTYFSPFPSRTLPRSTRTMTESGQLRSSISLPGYHVDFFSFAEHVSFEHSTGSPWSVIHSGREGNINKQIYKTQTFVHTRSSIRQSASPCSCLCSGAPRPVCDPGAGAATFFSNRKYRYRPHTQPDVGNCWPWIEEEIVREVALGG